MSAKLSMTYEVLYLYDESIDTWFAVDSAACYARGGTFLEAWSNLTQNRIANGYELSV